MSSVSPVDTDIAPIPLVISGLSVQFFTNGGVTQLLLRAENRILRCLEDAELNHGFGGNFDLLLSLWIDPGASFPLLFYELPKSRHDEFAVLFGSFVGDGVGDLRSLRDCCGLGV